MYQVAYPKDGAVTVSGNGHSPDDRLLTVAEAALRLNVSHKTIRKYIDAGLLQAKRLPHGQFRILPSAVVALLRNP